MSTAEWFASQTDPIRDPEISREGREILEAVRLAKLKQMQLNDLAGLVRILRMVR